MSLTLDFFVASRYSLGHKRSRLGRFIALLSGMGLVLGVAMMITVLSVMNGFDRELREKILVLVPHIKLYTGAPIENWQQVISDVQEQPGVLSAHPYSELQVLLKFRNQVEPALIHALDPDLERQSGSLGELLGNETLDSIEGGGILLGEGLIERLGVEPGTEVAVLLFGNDGSALKTGRLKIAGVLHTGTEADQRIGLVSLDSLASIPGQTPTPLGFRVQTNELFESNSLAYALLDRIGFQYRASTWAMTHGNLYQAIQMSRNLVGLIVFLILAIAAFNLIATLMIASADKQNDLAVLKTMGATPGGLARIFALQGFIIGMIGAGIGALAGVFLSTQVSSLTTLVELVTGESPLESSVYPLDYLPSDLNLVQVAVVLIVAIFLSVLAALYPAWKVSRVDPAEVLRYE